MWLEPMNKLFPRLGDLSLLSTTTETNLVLPELLQAPNLSRLSLHGIGLPKKFPLLSSTTALSTLSLTHILESSYFSPGHLVPHLQGLPHLEELSVGFAIPIPLPSSEGKLLPPPIPPVTLPILRRLTFRGVDAYLENLVAQINTPLLERLSLTFFFDLAFTLVNLTEFIHRTEGFGCLAARVTFNKDSASIDTGLSHCEQRGIGKLSLLVNCKPLDWQIDSTAQVCSALGNVLSAVEELTLDLNVDGMPSDWGNPLDNMLWYELLLPFIGVKELHIGSSLTSELSQALELVAGGLVLELLPELQNLGVQLEIDDAKRGFSAFIETWESVGRPVHLLALPSIPHAEPEVLRPDVVSQPDAVSRASWPDVVSWLDAVSRALQPDVVSQPDEVSWVLRPDVPVVSRASRPDVVTQPDAKVQQGYTTTVKTPGKLSDFDRHSFLKHMNNIGKSYKNQAIHLISIWQTFIQAEEQTFRSYDELIFIRT